MNKSWFPMQRSRICKMPMWMVSTIHAMPLTDKCVHIYQSLYRVQLSVHLIHQSSITKTAWKQISQAQIHANILFNFSFKWQLDSNNTPILSTRKTKPTTAVHRPFPA
jgi:hypothetical protein